MGEKTIGEVARESGIRASALRYYEAEGLLPAARRSGGKRVYDAAQLDRLAVIELAKGVGFTIAEVRVLLGGFARHTAPGKRWRSLAADKMRELQARIDQARRMKKLLEVLAQCQCPTLADCGRVLRDTRADTTSPARTKRLASPKRRL